MLNATNAADATFADMQKYSGAYANKNGLQTWMNRSASVARIVVQKASHSQQNERRIEHEI